MSSGPLLILMALTSFLVLPRPRFQASKPASVAELLLNDEIDKAETLLDQQPASAAATAYRGEIAYRRGDFSGADHLYREAVRMEEKTARAHFGLGKLALAKLKNKEAIAAFKRAIDLDPDEALYHLYAAEAYSVDKRYSEQKTELERYIKLADSSEPDRLAEAKAGLDMLAALAGKEAGAAEAPEKPAAIPFRAMLNLIFTPVMINGQGPYNFVIDTGATQTVIGERLATSQNIKPVATTIMHGVGGAGKVESKMYTVDELGIGDVKLKNLPVGTFNDPLVTQIADGIIGTASLSDFIVTINYPERQMELSRKPPDSAGLPVWYFSNLLLVPIEVNGKFKGNFVVDTGAVTTVFSHSMAAKLGVTEDTPDAKVDVGIAGVGGTENVVLRVPDVTLKVGDTNEIFPQVVSIDLKNISRMIGTEISGVVGYDFLSKYKVTLDYNKAEIRLVK
jgi:tetratricopeptide (TPR) repeat protein